MLNIKNLSASIMVTIVVDPKKWYDTASRRRSWSLRFVAAWDFFRQKKKKNRMSKKSKILNQAKKKILFSLSARYK